MSDIACANLKHIHRATTHCNRITATAWMQEDVKQRDVVFLSPCTDVCSLCAVVVVESYCMEAILSVLLSHEVIVPERSSNLFDLVSEEGLGCVECKDTCSVCVISSHP